MKYIYKALFLLFVMISFSISGQVVFEKVKSTTPLRAVKSASGYGEIESLKSITEKPRPRFRKYKKIPNKIRRFEYTNLDNLPVKRDAARQKRKGRSPSLSTIQAWNGISELSQGVMPPDPSGAVGKSHYVQMVNTAMQVFDKTGNSLWGPTALGSVFPGSKDDGDPIVLYDKFADRWFISQFQIENNKVLIAISQTPDPLGAWYYYTFSFDEFPDYPKFSIWGNGYYMTLNTTTQNAVCFERDKMLKGDGSAKMIALTFPDAQNNGFFSALPAHADGNSLPNNPINLFYFQDDGWAVGVDRIKIWEMNVDWTETSNSSILLKQEIPVTAFNSEFDVNWEDLTQPNTNQKIDAIPGAFMYMAQYQTFQNYNSIVLNHTVDVDLTASKNAGIRWYELREENNSWSLYQEGTYSPDDQSRWLGSLAMDRQGNIGLAYSITSKTTFPSLKFTGRKKDDILGEMTINESGAFSGDASQTSSTRFGDYAQMTLDPSDGLTFWYTGEYVSSNGWETGVFSFKIGSEYDHDISVQEVTSPLSGDLTSAEVIKVLIKNNGNNTASNFPISYQVQAGLITETFSGSILSGDTAYFTFNEIVDLSVAGFHDVSIVSSLSVDEDRLNDTLKTTVYSSYSNDVGVSLITSPTSQIGLGFEDVTVNVKNYGNNSVSEIPLKYSLNGNEVTDTLKSTILAGEHVRFKFFKKLNLSIVGTYVLSVYSDYDGDLNSLNDTSKITLKNLSCNPTADCDFGDRILNITMNGLSNSSECSSNGYGDFTHLSTYFKPEEPHTISVSINESDHQLSAWIDFNDNLIFEESEFIIKDSKISYEESFIVTLPENTPVGSHILRFRTHWLESSADPCIEFDYGETEDYVADIVLPTSVDAVQFPFSIKLKVLNDNLIVKTDKPLLNAAVLELFNSLGQSLKSTSLDPNAILSEVFSLSNLAKGIYYLKVSDDAQQEVQQFMVK